MTTPLWVSLVVTAVLAWSAPHQPSPAVNRDAQIQKAFTDRVQEYVDLRNKIEGDLPRLPDRAEPAAISSHQQALLKLMQRARSGAKQGDIFRDESRHLIRRLISGALAHQGSAPRKAMRDEDPGVLPVRVNGPYPTSKPLATVPPQVLIALPRLPENQELEYRFVGERLLLLDGKANMVVDYMDHALP